LCRILAGTTHVQGKIESLQVEAALALAKLGQTDEQTIATLKDARQSEAYEVRAAALWALLELGAAEEDMIKIPAGEFLMGSPEGEGRSNEHPQHALYLPDYYIARTPVTNAQYARFVANTGHEPPRHWKDNTLPSKISDHPVVNVSWDDCVAYARWLGGVLPSEAEWEKAAGWDPRTGRKRRYPWGDAWDSARCNSGETRPRRTTPVGQYSPEGDSAYGCVDMAGNVWEWTRSLHEAYPYDPEDGREDLKRSGSRVLRGGSFVSKGDYVRCAYRSHFNPLLHLRYDGFRVGVAVAPFSPTSEP
jgi:formylglycine-generating enzyme required for sulfatase activity